MTIVLTVAPSLLIDLTLLWGLNVRLLFWWRGQDKMAVTITLESLPNEVSFSVFFETNLTSLDPRRGTLFLDYNYAPLLRLSLPSVLQHHRSGSPHPACQYLSPRRALVDPRLRPSLNQSNYTTIFSRQPWGRDTRPTSDNWKWRRYWWTWEVERHLLSFPAFITSGHW